MLFIPTLTVDDIAPFDAVLEINRRELKRVIWLQITEPIPGPWMLWGQYRRETLPAILVWRQRKLVSDVEADVSNDALAELVWQALQRPPSYP